MRETLKAFLADYEAATVPAQAHGHREWMGAVLLHVTGHYNQIYLRRIWTNPSLTGMGWGTACLQWLLTLVKKHGVEMIGHASNDFLGKRANKPSVRCLRRWYKKHGARFDRHGAFTFGGER